MLWRWVEAFRTFAPLGLGEVSTGDLCVIWRRLKICFSCIYLECSCREVIPTVLLPSLHGP